MIYKDIVKDSIDKSDDINSLVCMNFSYFIVNLTDLLREVDSREHISPFSSILTLGWVADFIDFLLHHDVDEEDLKKGRWMFPDVIVEIYEEWYRERYEDFKTEAQNPSVD